MPHKLYTYEFRVMKQEDCEVCIPRRPPSDIVFNPRTGGLLGAKCKKKRTEEEKIEKMKRME
jgi:hypothetical protein